MILPEIIACMYECAGDREIPEPQTSAYKHAFAFILVLKQVIIFSSDHSKLQLYSLQVLEI